MIPIELWQSDEMRKRRENAVAKALKERPKVEPLEVGLDWSHYLINGKYKVTTYMDLDGQVFIECSCPAGRPPIDENTGLPSREAVPCYHAASVLVHIAEIERMEEEDGPYV